MQATIFYCEAGQKILLGVGIAALIQKYCQSPPTDSSTNEIQFYSMYMGGGGGSQTGVNAAESTKSRHLVGFF